MTVGTIVGLMASGHAIEDILTAHPYLELENLQELLIYYAWHVEKEIQKCDFYL